MRAPRPISIPVLVWRIKPGRGAIFRMLYASCMTQISNWLACAARNTFATVYRQSRPGLDGFAGSEHLANLHAPTLRARLARAGLGKVRVEIQPRGNGYGDFYLDGTAMEITLARDLLGER